MSLLTSTSAQAQTSPYVPTVDNPNAQAVAGLSAAKRFFALAHTRRVDIAYIGDSNSRQGDTGHEDGMGRGFAGLFGLYATGVLPGTGYAGYGSYSVGVSSAQGGTFAGIPDGHPAKPYGFKNEWFMPTTFVYLAPNLGTGQSYNLGLFVYGNSTLGIDSALRYHLTRYVSSPPVGSGLLTLSARTWYGNVYNDYAFKQFPANPNEPEGIQDIPFDIPAGPRENDILLIGLASFHEWQETRGETVLMYHRLERTDKAAGIAMSPLWEMGGKSARDVMLAFTSSPAEDFILPMREWYRQMTRLQNGSPVVCIQINHGGNDVGAFGDSLGPIGGIPSNTPEGFSDNLHGIMNFLRSHWVQNGYDPSNLFFLMGPYHPRGTEDFLQRAYSQVWRDIAAEDPQVFVVDGMQLSTHDEFASKGFLRNGDDPYHLSPAGYSAWGRAGTAALAKAVCPADFDLNGRATVTDIFAFLSAWFNGSINADVNYSGSVTVNDIFAFLRDWFAGCQ